MRLNHGWGEGIREEGKKVGEEEGGGGVIVYTSFGSEDCNWHRCIEQFFFNLSDGRAGFASDFA